MKPKLVICIAAATLGWASAPTHAAEPAAAAQVHQGRGTVRSVETEKAKLNLAHGAMPSLNWPAMTMDFQVKDKAILKDIKPGQKVEFDLVQEGPGQFVVTRIKPTN